MGGINSAHSYYFKKFFILNLKNKASRINTFSVLTIFAPKYTENNRLIND